ncbi:MAG: amidohydrolase family protein [Myxococcota bacterium]
MTIRTCLLTSLLVVGYVLPGLAGEDAFDVVVNGGRVMDPESGLDAVRSLGIRDGKVVEISRTALVGDETIDAAGLVVAPGFIDLHVHGQHDVGYDYMARDGVTTALDLEAGVKGIEEFLEERSGKARIHYGAAAGHIGSRIYVKHGFSTGHALTGSIDGGAFDWFMKMVQRWFKPTAWMYEEANSEEIIEVVRSLRDELDAGAIGVGMGLAYTPGAGPDEIRSIFEFASSRGVPCFVHMAEQKGEGDMGPIVRLIAYARDADAALHIVHINSSSRSSIDKYLALIEEARASGLDITTEAYPYTAGSTMIESALFDEGFQERRGIDYGDLQWVATGERLTEETFGKYRAQGGPVIMHMMKPEWIDRAIAHPRVMIASDGMPMIEGTHPRGAGTHARVLGLYVREKGAVTLMDAIRKLSFMPAQRLEAFVPAMANKGRLRVGADADITVFDIMKVTDRATFDDSLRYSEGIHYVLVDGMLVVRDGELVEGAAPGKAIVAADTSGS